MLQNTKLKMYTVIKKFEKIESIIKIFVSKTLVMKYIQILIMF